MTTVPDCDQTELVAAYAVRALSPRESDAMQTHISACQHCRRELETLRPVVDSFVSWPTDVLRPSTSLWERLTRRISAETGGEPHLSPTAQWTEPGWESVAPGIFCKLLATDHQNDRVSMLVRLEPGTEYPPHTHAAFEELHLLCGELWINERKLNAGDYYRAESGTADERVWSETGCTCVLMTSVRDALS